VGYFAAGSVVTSFISNFVEGGLRAGLVVREDRLDDAAETVFRATLATGLVMSLLALASAPLISVIFDSHTAGVVAASMSGGILLFSLTNVPEAILQREFSVRRRLIVGPAVALSFAVVSVTLAAYGFGVWSMVIGTYASSLVWVLTLWWICDWRPGRGRADLPMYREMVRFGLPLAIGLFADQTVKGVRSVATGRILGVPSLGLFRYGERIAQIPVGGIIEVGANSLFPAYSRIASDPERFRRAFLHAMGLLVVVAAALSGGLIALGEPLVVVVLGPEWRGAGVVLVAMSGLGIGTAIGTSAEAIKGAGRTSLLNWITAIQTVLGIGLVVLMAPVWGLLGVGLSVSITALTVAFILLAMARPIVGLTWGELGRTILPPVVAATITTVLVFLLEHEVLRSPEHSVLVGLLLLLADGLLFLALYGVVLRLIAPASYHLMRDMVGSLGRHVWARLRPAGTQG
jgi:O-antigen/teichoic acid export membrane protein